MANRKCLVSWLWARAAGVIFLLIALLGPLPASAAVELDFWVRQTPPFDLSGPFGAAVDPLGNIYVADTYKHRIVKYDERGLPRRAWGSFGSGTGQLYYPLGIAVGANPSNNATRVYVADTFNHRIVVYDSAGVLQFTFGELGSGDGQLDHPEGIAVLPAHPGGSRDVCVADSRNARVSCFSENGNWKRSFYCSQCPGSGFVKPVGITMRRLEDGEIRIYVVDNYPGRVHILDGGGRWIRSYGGPGESGQLSFPDDIAVDPGDGTSYVVDSGIGIEKVSAFGRDGKFLYSFNTDGFDPFFQPHGLTMDEQGNLYVVNTGASVVDKFKFSAPKLFVASKPDASRKYWLDTNGVWLEARYNGVEQTCLAGGRATITAAGKSWIIRTSASGITVDSLIATVKMDLTPTQTNQIKLVWKAGGKINVVTRFTARCEDNKLLSATYSFEK